MPDEDLNAVMESIAAELAEDLNTVHRTEFHVEDAASAEWVVRKMLEAQAGVAAVKGTYAEMLRQAQARVRYWEWRFGPELEAWASRHLDGKHRSVGVGPGVCQFRKGKETIRPKPGHDQVAIGWAREYCPAAVKVTETLLLTPLLEHCKATGEIAEGCELVPATDHFSVRPGRAKRARAADAEETE